jgi:hypothetical protein
MNVHQIATVFQLSTSSRFVNFRQRDYWLVDHSQPPKGPTWHDQLRTLIWVTIHERMKKHAQSAASNDETQAIPPIDGFRIHTRPVQR